MMERQRQIERIGGGMLDVLILGGGINGAGIARDLALRARAAGRPLRIGLVEQRHFASGTSGKNSQLIHGGLRYLKYLEFGLVREALRERATLLAVAPHLVKPLPLLMPFYSRFASVYYGAGLWLYDTLAGSRNVARHRTLSAPEVAQTEPGLSREGLASGAVFYDCRVNSARLVLANITGAIGLGAAAANYVHARGIERQDRHWRVRLEDALSGERFEARAKKLVDARGPWSGTVRLVRGSHLVLPKVNAGDEAIAYFEPDGRIVFIIPWGERQELSLVGTTDVDHENGPDAVRISHAEVAYLLGIVRRLFPQAPAEPVSQYSSLRPLLLEESGSPTSASREHRIWNDKEGILHVAGGKYTTYRSMSEEAADAVTGEIAPELRWIHRTAEARFTDPGPVASEADAIARAVREEMAQRLSDLLFVSTYWGYERRFDRAGLLPYAREMGKLLGWDEPRIEQEIAAALAIPALPAGAVRHAGDA